jgi:hypothetical protein
MLIIPAILESFRSLKDRTLKITFETIEPNPDQMEDIRKSNMTTGFLAFNSEPFSSSQEKYLTELEVDYDDPKKTPSKRLRGVLYRNWEVDKKGYKTFEDYYRSQMEMLIVHFKGKLE